MGAIMTHYEREAPRVRFLCEGCGEPTDREERMCALCRNESDNEDKGDD
jgi:predicted amidophosphoribosyltransferase